MTLEENSIMYFASRIHGARFAHGNYCVLEVCRDAYRGTALIRNSPPPRVAMGP